MMILEILKWIEMAIFALFGTILVLGIGCVLTFFTVIAIDLEQKQQMDEELPFHCMTMDKICPTPDIPCNECKIYQIAEPKHDNF
jgi:hypothetical protein